MRKKKRSNLAKRPKTPILLEVTSRESIQWTKRQLDEILRFQWNVYSELAFQRKSISVQLAQALTGNASAGFKFSGWQRAVKYCYSLHPLCAVGSLIDPGGRFNIGDIDRTNFPTFSALYVAADKATALEEMLGQEEPAGAMSRLDMALTKSNSLSLVSVSGAVDEALDLRVPGVLTEFVNLIKGFRVSESLWRDAERLGQVVRIVRESSELLKELLAREWRRTPMWFDIPATSQLFGQMVFMAGIEGVVYPSSLTKRDCIAIFPAQFANSSSFVRLDDVPPDQRVPIKIDQTNWQQCEQTFEELFGQKQR